MRVCSVRHVETFKMAYGYWQMFSSSRVEKQEKKINLQKANSRNYNMFSTFKRERRGLAEAYIAGVYR